MNKLNYAEEYQQALAQAFPYSLYYGDLYNTPNNQIYKWTSSDTIKIPVISTKGRVDGDRDTISVASRNYDNEWETKTLSNHRQWSTLIHPRDVIETDFATTIKNITQVYNEENKFPEMDAYTVSKIHSDYEALGMADETVAELTIDNVLDKFDNLMIKMDEHRVPLTGRILYTDPRTKKLIENAKQINQVRDISTGKTRYNRIVSDIDNTKIVPVPTELLKTAYDFSEGYTVGASAKDILMFLVHPIAVLTPINYEFAKLDAPSAMSSGKYVYFEESFEDVFILNYKKHAIQFITKQKA